MRKDLTFIAGQFALQGTLEQVVPLGAGLINDSFHVITREPEAPDYVLQRINHAIFRDVDLLQSNIFAVTRHIRQKLEARGEEDIDRKVLTFLRTSDGSPYYFDGADYWRVMRFIPGAYTYETVNEKYSAHAGETFGAFQQMLADLPVTLGETIPDFHNMEFRLSQLREAVAADPAGRVQGVQQYIDEIGKNAAEMCKAERLHREGRLPKRVCHCDTKVNNMLFDQQGRVLCVIDLDTVMPSYVFSDYGDFLRSAANTGEEDDRDPDRIGFDMDIFRAFTRGYLRAARSFLTPVETENLPYAATLFPYMQCVRFLADYINGDTYYKIAYPEHNLVRARAQYTLWKRAEARLPEMQAFIEECLAG